MTQSIYDAIIIGSGFSGICAAIKLKEAGIENILMLEKAASVGGTWRENTYPGAACDVQSHLYSYSFAGNSQWSHVFSGWAEIKAYIESVYNQYNLAGNTQFAAHMKSAHFDEANGQWQVDLKNGQRLLCRSLILGTGPLHVPSLPNIKGLDSFTGQVFHSANWNHELDLSDKHVVSIGTGGSAIQYVPEVAKTAQHLTVFQRTPAWVMPRNERRYFAFEKALFKYLPLWRKAYRSLLYWTNEARILPMRHPFIAKGAQLIAGLHLRMQVKDPELRQQLTPDYTIGCKRILISNQYFPAFNRDNVDLNTHGIAEVRANSIVDETGKETPADVIILGTGFAADPNVYLKDMPITGLHGKSLLDHWQDGAHSFLGLSVQGFPNLLQMVGPNTGLGHNSMIFMIEAQTRYIVDAVKKILATANAALDVKPQVEQAFNEKLQRKLVGTVWATGCASWYKRSDGKNFTIWPYTTFNYRWQTRKLNLNHYQLIPHGMHEASKSGDETEKMNRAG